MAVDTVFLLRCARLRNRIRSIPPEMRAMSHMLRYACPVAAFLLVGTAVAAGDLSTAKALYNSAAYDEALAQLEHVDNPELSAEIDQYRALCLIALGRAKDAERALEHLVNGHPLYHPPDETLSPRLLVAFRDVRMRVLPIVARQQYEKGKRAFDAGDLPTAVQQFKELLAIISELDSTEDPGLVDLQRLGEGFLMLSEAREPKTAPAAMPASVSAGAAEPSAVVAPAIFSTGDPSVVPPLDVDRQVPKYLPPLGFERQGYRGVL